MGKNTFRLEVMGQTKALDLMVNDIRFIATMDRPGDYEGEFGFDWMRVSYESSSLDYNKLKKEYTPDKIQGQEYFVPWLSMFPGQKGVKLELCLQAPEGHTNLGELTDADIIKFPKKDGVRFEPEQLTFNEARENYVITVICDEPLKDDVQIDFLNREDDILGKLNIFKNANHEKLHFNITPVRILRSGLEEGDKKLIEDQIDLDLTVNQGKPNEKRYKGFGDKKTDLAGDMQNLQTFLNTHSLNQALLKCTIGEVHDIVIDEHKWIADDLILDEGKLFKGSLLDKFEEEFKKQHPKAFKQRGIIVFLSPLNNIDDDGSEGAGGYANMRDVDAKNCAIFYSNLFDKPSIVHEIAHVAGLEHFFKDKNNLTAREVVAYNERKLEIDGFFDEIIESESYTKDEISDMWNRYKDEMRDINSQLYTYNRNMHKFKKSETENFMDYNNEKKVFNKFQWEALGEDVIKFYNS